MAAVRFLELLLSETKSKVDSPFNAIIFNGADHAHTDGFRTTLLRASGMWTQMRHQLRHCTYHFPTQFQKKLVNMPFIGKQTPKAAVIMFNIIMITVDKIGPRSQSSELPHLVFLSDKTYSTFI